MSRFTLALSMTLLVALAGAIGGQEKPLDNSEVVKLTKLDLGDAVVIAKIKSAKEVRFDLATEDLVKLKNAGVSKEVIAAMLDRSATKTSPSAAPGDSFPKVTLHTKDGAFDLSPVDGDVKTIVAPFVGMRRFVIFSEVSAGTRTRDKRPSVVVASNKDPRKVWWLVRLDQDKDADDMDRSIDVESPGMWGGVLSSAPDEDYMVQYDAVEEGSGMWRITPRKDLKPGEYGMYIGKGELTATLFDFGVDR